MILNKTAPQRAAGQTGNTLSHMPILTGAGKIDDHSVALTASEPDALQPYDITSLFIIAQTARQTLYTAIPSHGVSKRGPGSPPDLSRLPSGCAFAERCPHALRATPASR